MKAQRQPSSVAASSMIRPGALALGIALALGTAPASAVVSITFDTTDLHTASSTGKAVTSPNYDTSAWINYAETCANVINAAGSAGAGCLATAVPQPDSATMLFSWGESVQGASNNSRLQMTYSPTNATDKFTLTTLEIAAGSSTTRDLGPVNGPTSAFLTDKGVADPSAFTNTQGSGSMVVYAQPDLENNASFQSHFGFSQLVDVRHTHTDVTDPSNPVAVITTLGTGLRVLPNIGSNWSDYIDADGFTAKPFTQQFDFSGLDLQVQADDVIEFRFYEQTGLWNNANVGNVGGFPDAYYGDMAVTVSGILPTATAPTIAVTNVDFGNVRAGTIPGTQTMTVTNSAAVGAEDLAGHFDAINDPGPFTGTNLNQNQDFSGLEPDNANSATRTFGFNPGTLAVHETTGRDATLNQQVTGTTIGTTNTPQTAQVTGTTVGPVLGVTDGARTLGYNSTINLSANLTEDDAKDLAIANLFATSDGTRTSLTFANVGLLDNTSGAFKIVGGATAFDAFSNSIVLAGGLGTAKSTDGISANGETLPFMSLWFDPTGLLPGTYSATLFFETDMNRAFGSASNTIAYLLSANVPVPGSLLLFMAGALAYPLFGRRRNTHRRPGSADLQSARGLKAPGSASARLHAKRA